MVSFLGILVAKKWFQTIFIAFLPVGHTHEDVDAMWGRLGNLKKVIPCESPVIIYFYL